MSDGGCTPCPAGIPKRQQPRLGDWRRTKNQARGVRTAFTSKEGTLKRVVNNILPFSWMNPIVKAAVEG